MRSRTTKDIYTQKQGPVVDLDDPVLSEAIGPAERRGCWLIYGAEKNGKTWFALTLARCLAQYERVAYISAEEGLDKSFTDACRRAGITTDDKILWDEYMTVTDIVAKFSKPKTPSIIFIDNLTIYQDEMKPSELKKTLVDAIPGKLFIMISHEERKLPYPALGRMAKKMAKVIVHVQGLRASVVSRFGGGGGDIAMDQEKCQLFWGGENENND